MSSSIRKIATRNKTRKGLNSRGKRPGLPYTPSRSKYAGPRRPQLSKLNDKHDLSKADKDCRTCHGTGVVVTPYAIRVEGNKRQSLRLACGCVPLKEEKDK